MSMDINIYQRVLRYGNDPIILNSNDYKGIDWAEEEVEKIKKITDLRKQVEEAEKIWKVCDDTYTILYEPPLGVNDEGLSNIKKLKSVCEELITLKNKTISSKPKNTPNTNSQTKNQSLCSFCNTKSNLYHLIYNEITKSLQWATLLSTGNNVKKVFCNQGCFDEWWKIKYSKNEPIRPQKPTNINNRGDYEQDNYETSNNITNEICAKCNKSLQVGDEYYYKKNDNKKFCSTNCYDKHYKASKTELEKKEEVFNAYETIWKEVFEKTPLVSPEEISLLSADVFYKLLEQKQEKGQLQTYLQQKLEEIRQIRFGKSNSNSRERERAKFTHLLHHPQYPIYSLR